MGEVTFLNADLGAEAAASRSQILVDGQQSEHVAIWIFSNLNRPLLIQLRGNDESNHEMTASFDINAPSRMLAGAKATVPQRHMVSVNLDDSLAPFFGLNITQDGTPGNDGRVDVMPYSIKDQTDTLLRQMLGTFAALAEGY